MNVWKSFWSLIHTTFALVVAAKLLILSLGKTDKRIDDKTVMRDALVESCYSVRGITISLRE